jgi:integrase
MGVYIRSNSPYYYLWLDGHRDERGRPLREATKIRTDAPTPQQRKDNRQAAEQAYHARMTELARGTLQPTTKPAITFADFAAWFGTNVLPKRRGKERESEILVRLLRWFGPMLLSAIDPSRVEEYTAARLTQPTIIRAKKRTKARSVTAGPNTINREVDLLKAMMQAAVPKYLDASPLYGMKRLATVTPKRRVLSEDEERRLLDVMTPDDKAFFLIGMDTLARLSDILDLKVTDDHKDTLWIADPKTGGGFYAPISQRLRKALDAMPPPATTQIYLFPKRRIASTERDRRNGIRQMLERYCAAVKPKIEYGRARGLTFHWATRRTAASRMLSRKVPLATVQKVGRWKDPTVVLGIYHELIGDDDRRAVEAISESGVRVGRSETVGKRRKSSEAPKRLRGRKTG